MRRAPTHRWRGGRVAEGGGLLNRYTVNPVSWVRIPSPPPPLLDGLCCAVPKLRQGCAPRCPDAVLCRMNRLGTLSRVRPWPVGASEMTDTPEYTPPKVWTWNKP